MCAQTRPSDQGCLHCRLAFALPLTASSGTCSTLPGTLDQGCLYCRLAFVLPLRTRIGCLQTNLVLNQLSDKEANPLPAMPYSQRGACKTKPGPWDQGASIWQSSRGASAHQVVTDGGVYAVD